MTVALEKTYPQLVAFEPLFPVYMVVTQHGIEPQQGLITKIGTRS